MCNDAQLARDIAKAELMRQEELNIRVRKEREKELMTYKKQAEEKKEFAERVERRLNRMSLSNQEEAAVGEYIYVMQLLSGLWGVNGMHMYLLECTCVYYVLTVHTYVCTYI